MKRKNNLYKKICDINNIIKYEHNVSLNTKNKTKVEKFEEYYSENIYKIKDKLEGRSYVPLEYNIFLFMNQN